MCGASSTKLWNRHPKPPAGSCGKSNTSTGWKPGCGRSRHGGAGPKLPRSTNSAPTKAGPLWNALNTLWSAQAQRHGFSAARACLGIAMDYALGPVAHVGSCIWRMAGWRWTTTWWKTADPPDGAGQEKLAIHGGCGCGGERGAIIYTVIETLPPQRVLTLTPTYKGVPHPPAHHDQLANPGSHPGKRGAKRLCEFSGRLHHNIVIPLWSETYDSFIRTLSRGSRCNAYRERE